MNSQRNIVVFRDRSLADRGATGEESHCVTGAGKPPFCLHQVRFPEHLVVLMRLKFRDARGKMRTGPLGRANTWGTD
jgi:hypothetical protein